MKKTTGTAEYRTIKNRTVSVTSQMRPVREDRCRPQLLKIRASMYTGVTNTLKITMQGVPMNSRKSRLISQKHREPLSPEYMNHRLGVIVSSPMSSGSRPWKANNSR